MRFHVSTDDGVVSLGYGSAVGLALGILALEIYWQEVWPMESNRNPIGTRAIGTAYGARGSGR